MSKLRQEVFTPKTCKDVKLWSEAIQDGETLLKQAQKRVRELRATIRVCKAKRDAGERFPGQTKPKRRARAA